MKQEITITISGKYLTGKGKIAELIRKILSDKGAQIKIDESNGLNKAIGAYDKKRESESIDLKDYSISLNLFQEKK